jgi:hypothetical protein
MVHNSTLAWECWCCTRASCSGSFFKLLLDGLVGFGMLRARHATAVTEPLEILPPSLWSDWSAETLLHPLCHFRTTPQAPICWRGLQGLCEFLLELGGKQGTAHINLMAMISDAGFSLRIPAPNHRADPPGGVAKQLSYRLWRFALLR